MLMNKALPEDKITIDPEEPLLSWPLALMKIPLLNFLLVSIKSFTFYNSLTGAKQGIFSASNTGILRGYEQWGSVHLPKYHQLPDTQPHSFCRPWTQLQESHAM